MEPVPVVVHPTPVASATPTPPIPGAAPKPPSASEILAKAAEERAQLNLDAADLLHEEVRRSDQLSDLLSGLARVQARMQPAARDSKNPFFKSTYASLASCWAAWRAAKPEDEGLSVVQLADGRGRIVVITTILFHSNDQWIEQRFAYIAVDEKAQSVAACTTYGRRIAFCAVTGIATEDDDGESQREKLPEGVRWDKGPTELQHVASEPQAAMPGQVPKPVVAPPTPNLPSAPTAPVVAPENVPPVAVPRRAEPPRANPAGGAGTPVPSPPGRPPTAGAPARPMFAPVQAPQPQAQPQAQQTAAASGGTVVMPPPAGMKPPTRAPGRS